MSSIARTYTLGEFSCQVVFTKAEEAFSLPPGARCLKITDQNVAQALNLQGDPAGDVLVFPAGEEAKTWNQVESAISRGFSLGLARDDFFMGIGGGVVTDMAAFAASVYLRGCKLILVPTTLLAMVDASFGGKTGINFGGFKNMVGTFYPAVELRICTDFLQTLPEREYRSGLGEVIKSAMLADAELWSILKNKRDNVLSRDSSVIEALVQRSLAVKGRIVEEDFREENIRAHLNLGHTFAHALEAVAGFGSWSHGEAVCWGMVKAVQLSHRLGLAKADYLHEVRELLEAYGFRTSCTMDHQKLLAAMKMDKKKKGGEVRFVLQRGLCDTLTQRVADEDVLAVLALD